MICLAQKGYDKPVGTWYSPGDNVHLGSRQRRARLYSRWSYRTIVSWTYAAAGSHRDGLTQTLGGQRHLRG